jgi:hypothetical protein
MASTLIVLVIMLICVSLAWLVVLAATFRLAKRNGQAVRSMSLSLRHGCTAEFFKKSEGLSAEKQR